MNKGLIFTTCSNRKNRFRSWCVKISASFFIIHLRYNEKSIITVCNWPIEWAVTNLAVSLSVLSIIQSGYTLKLFFG